MRQCGHKPTQLIPQEQALFWRKSQPKPANTEPFVTLTRVETLVNGRTYDTATFGTSEAAKLEHHYMGNGSWVAYSNQQLDIAKQRCPHGDVYAYVVQHWSDNRITSWHRDTRGTY